MQKEKIIIIILAVTLFAIIQYNILEKYQTDSTKEISEIYQIAYSNGVKDAIIALFNQTESCHESIIHSGNLTREFIDVSCIKQQSHS